MDIKKDRPTRQPLNAVMVPKPKTFTLQDDIGGQHSVPFVVEPDTRWIEGANWTDPGEKVPVNSYNTHLLDVGPLLSDEAAALAAKRGETYNFHNRHFHETLVDPAGKVAVACDVTIPSVASNVLNSVRNVAAAIGDIAIQDPYWDYKPIGPSIKCEETRVLSSVTSVDGSSSWVEHEGWKDNGYKYKRPAERFVDEIPGPLASPHGGNVASAKEPSAKAPLAKRMPGPSGPS